MSNHPMKEIPASLDELGGETYRRLQAAALIKLFRLTTGEIPRTTADLEELS